MRRDVCLGLVVLAMLVATSCDTDEPLAVGTQNAELSIRAIGARVPQYLVWDLIEDSDGVPGADDVNGDGVGGDVTLWCRDFGLGDPTSVPWTYSLKIKVIRGGDVIISEQGQVEPEVLTSSEAEASDGSRAPYDSFQGSNSDNINGISVVHLRGRCRHNPQVTCNPLSTSDWCTRVDGSPGVQKVCDAIQNCSEDFDTICDPGNPGNTCSSQGAGVCTSAGVCSGDPGIVCEPTCADLGVGTCIQDTVTRKFFFQTTNRRRLTAASRELLNAKDNFIAETCRGDAACENSVEANLGDLNPALGICPGQDLGNPGIDPNTADANSDPSIFGFTLEKGDTVIVEARRSDTTPGGGQVIQFVAKPGLLAEFTVDGSTLQGSEVVGSLVSTDTESPNISFSFTSK